MRCKTPSRSDLEGVLIKRRIISFAKLAQHPLARSSILIEAADASGAKIVAGQF